MNGKEFNKSNSIECPKYVVQQGGLHISSLSGFKLRKTNLK